MKLRFGFLVFLLLIAASCSYNEPFPEIPSCEELWWGRTAEGEQKVFETATISKIGRGEDMPLDRAYLTVEKGIRMLVVESGGITTKWQVAEDVPGTLPVVTWVVLERCYGDVEAGGMDFVPVADYWAGNPDNPHIPWGGDPNYPPRITFNR